MVRGCSQGRRRVPFYGANMSGSIAFLSMGLGAERMATVLGVNGRACEAGREGGARVSQAGGGPARPTEGGQMAAREQRSGCQMGRHLCGVEVQTGRSHDSGGLAQTC